MSRRAWALAMNGQRVASASELVVGDSPAVTAGDGCTEPERSRACGTGWPVGVPVPQSDGSELKETRSEQDTHGELGGNGTSELVNDLAVLVSLEGGHSLDALVLGNVLHLSALSRHDTKEVDTTRCQVAQTALLQGWPETETQLTPAKASFTEVPGWV